MVSRKNYRIFSSEFGCAPKMDSGLSHAPPQKRSMRSATAIVTGSMNIFMAIQVPGWGRHIKRAGLAWSQNSFSNKGSTGRLPDEIHSQISEATGSYLAAEPS